MRNMVKYMMVKCMIYSIGLISLVFVSGCSDSKNIPGEIKDVDGISLSKYTDNNSYFSLSKPASWNINTGEYISIKDPSDNGITKVRIQPIHLSGKYRNIDAKDIANYLIGKEKQRYQNFELESMSESGDKKIIELVALFKENGIDKKSVFTVFVNSPYAMLSSYETTKDKFSEKEKLLTTIIKSYQQFTPKIEAKSKIGELHEKNLDGKVKMLLPDDWNAKVFPACVGLVAFDGELGKNKKGVVFLNGLHQSIDPLPPGVTPEDYVTKYMQKDFNTLSDIKIIKYEDIDLSELRALGGDVKTMRISFKNNGIPSIGSFTINTYGTYVSSAVGYMWGIFSTEEEIAQDVIPLLKMWYSIDYSESTIGECRKSLERGWEGANKLGDKIRKEGEKTREENLKLYHERQNSNDEFLDKYSDWILDRDKVYNPETDEVYEVDINFYDYYDKHREEYKYKDMRELESGERLKYIPLDGRLHIQ